VEPLRIDDVLGRERYGAQRDEVRRRIIAYKRARRVAVGDRVTFVFEDRATLWYQTQEMLWVEHITDLDAIRDELAVYNALLPGPSDFSATMLIEITEQARIKAELERLIGIDRHVWLDIEGHPRVAAVFEEGRQTESQLSAVQYVRFPVDAGARARIVADAAVALAIDHPSYTHRAVVPDGVRASLAAELRDSAAVGAALRHVRDGR
jgi:hypothetical protein